MINKQPKFHLDKNSELDVICLLVFGDAKAFGRAIEVGIDGVGSPGIAAGGQHGPRQPQIDAGAIHGGVEAARNQIHCVADDLAFQAVAAGVP